MDVNHWLETYPMKYVEPYILWLFYIVAFWSVHVLPFFKSRSDCI